MSKLDLKKALGPVYKAGKKPSLVDVPPIPYLMVDGSGDPNTSKSFEEGCGALFGLAYTLKFTAKAMDGCGDYVVMPLQGLWWAEDMDVFLTGDKGAWQWTLMIAQPDFITPDMVGRAAAALGKRKGTDGLDRVRFEILDEGRSAQVMHIGPYDREEPTIRALHEFIEDQGLARRSLHHEIYLSDPRRADPEKLRTIIRQPVA